MWLETPANTARPALGQQSFRSERIQFRDTEMKPDRIPKEKQTTKEDIADEQTSIEDRSPVAVNTVVEKVTVVDKATEIDKVADMQTQDSMQSVATSEPEKTPVASDTASTRPSPVSSVVAESRLGGWTWLVHFGLKSAIVVGVGAILLAMIGFAQRSKWITASGFSNGTASTESETESGGGEDKRYICPMMCTPPSTEPGRCPVCAMELVEATGGGGGDGISVTIEASARRLVGIQTAISKLGEMTRTIRTIGSIDFDESRLSTISAYIDGRLEKMYANYVGVKVSEGDDLALIYSPQLYSAQTEFVTSLESSVSSRFDVGNSAMQEMARENLSELGMTEEQIASLSESRIPQSRIRIKSPQSGTVIEKSASKVIT